MNKERIEAYVAMLGLTVLWGYTWVVLKVATHDASPFAIAALRPAIGTAALFLFLALMRRSLRPTPFVATLVFGLLQTTGFTLLQTIAIALAGAGKIAVLVYTMPFWVALMAWPFLGERVRTLGWVALALAAIGLGFVVAPLDRATLGADLLAIGSGISWAASAVWAKRVRARYTVELLSLTTWQMLYGTIPLVLIALVVPERIAWTPSFTLAILFIGLLSQAVAWVVWLFVLHRLPAGVAGIASLATPVLGVVFAAIQLHDVPSVNETIGIVLIVVALILNVLPQRAPARAASASG